MYMLCYCYYHSPPSFQHHHNHQDYTPYHNHTHYWLDIVAMLHFQSGLVDVKMLILFVRFIYLYGADWKLVAPGYCICAVKECKEMGRIIIS